MMDSYTTHLREGKTSCGSTRKPSTPEGHATDLFADWATDYFEERARAKADQPFFLYLAFNAPHFPIEPPAEWLEKVKNTRPGTRSETRDQRRLRRAPRRPHRPRAGLPGEIPASPKTPSSSSPRTTAATFGSAQNNDPWRDGKQSHYDGGLRVPFVARWPGQITPGTRSDYPGLVFDYFPPFWKSPVRSPRPTSMPAASFPFSKEKRKTRTAPSTSSAAKGNDQYCGSAYHAIVAGHWKLLQNDPFSPLELYNLKTDPTEATDLIQKEPQVTKRLKALLRANIQNGGATPWQK